MQPAHVRQAFAGRIAASQRTNPHHIDRTVVDDVSGGIGIEGLGVGDITMHQQLVDAGAAVEGILTVALLPARRICAGAAVQRVHAQSADHAVVAVVAGHLVVADAAGQGVLAAAAVQLVGAVAAVQFVAAAANRVVEQVAPQHVGALAGVDEVVAQAADHEVVARVGDQHVVASAAFEALGAVVAKQHIVAIAAVQRDAAVLIGKGLRQRSVVVRGCADLDAVVAGAPAQHERFGRRGAEQARIDPDNVVAGAAVHLKVEQGCRVVRIGDDFDPVVPGAAVDDDRADAPVHFADDVFVRLGAAGDLDAVHFRGQVELGQDAVGDHDHFLVADGAQAQCSQRGPEVVGLARGIEVGVQPALLARILESQHADFVGHNGVLLDAADLAAFVLERQLAIFQRGDGIRAVVFALVVELGDDFVDKALGRLEDGDLREAHVDADPEERLEEHA